MSSIDSRIIPLIDVLYWKSNEKPETCKGYAPRYCEPCEHFSYCSMSADILVSLSEERRAELAKIGEEEMAFAGSDGVGCPFLSGPVKLCMECDCVLYDAEHQACYFVSIFLALRSLLDLEEKRSA